MSEEGQARSDTSYAFFFWLNWLWILAAIIVFLVSKNPYLLLAGGVGEVFWLTAGKKASGFQRYVALQEGQKREQRQKQRLQSEQAKLAYEYKERFRTLSRAQGDILKLAKNNPRLQPEIIKPELDKTQALLEAFVRLGVAHKQLTTYLDKNKLEDLAAQLQDAKAQAAKAPGEAALRQSLAQQIDIAQKRLDEHGRIVENERALAVQLQTIEQTMSFLQSKMLGFERPEQLAQQVDNVLTGLQAAERTLEETERIDAEISRMARQNALRS